MQPNVKLYLLPEDDARQATGWLSSTGPCHGPLAPRKPDRVLAVAYENGCALAAVSLQEAPGFLTASYLATNRGAPPRHRHGAATLLARALLELASVTGRELRIPSRLRGADLLMRRVAGRPTTEIVQTWRPMAVLAGEIVPGRRRRVGARAR